MPVRKCLFSIATFMLTCVGFTSVSFGQLIQPFAQDRRVFCQASATDGTETLDTGLIVQSPAEGDYGVWTGNTGNQSVSLMTGGGMSSQASYTGGWNGNDTISIEPGFSNASAGGGGPPTASAHGLAGQEFEMSFTLTQDVNYTFSYLMGGSELTPAGGVVYLQRIGDPEPLIEDQVPAPNGNIQQEGLTGSLTAGNYIIHFDITTETSFTGGGGGGGGNGFNFNFHVFVPSFQPGDLNCDTAVNTDDIGAYVLALTDPVAYDQVYECDINLADVNADGVNDGRDVQAFVALLVGP